MGDRKVFMNWPHEQKMEQMWRRVALKLEKTDELLNCFKKYFQDFSFSRENVEKFIGECDNESKTILLGVKNCNDKRYIFLGFCAAACLLTFEQQCEGNKTSTKNGIFKPLWTLIRINLFFTVTVRPWRK